VTALPDRPPGEFARVMICDDSAAIRGAIGRILEQDARLLVVARVGHGRAALDELQRRRGGAEMPDVLVLDIEMPVMDGLTALPQLLQAAPGLRVLMASTLTARGADVALQALRLGAADCILKPGSASGIDAGGFAAELIAKVTGLARLRRAAAAPRRAGQPGSPPGALPQNGSAAPRLRPAPMLPPLLVAIGSSTGGPQALFALVQALGRAVPVPVVLTQHMPATFMPILAEHITRLGAMPCAVAFDAEPLLAGRIHLAPGDRHLHVRKTATGLRAHLDDGPPENWCRPAVDPMLRSAAVACDGRVLGVILTGMGQDGLAGTERVIAGGGCALAQDEASSIVWGMPGAVARAGLCHAVLPPPLLAARILTLLRPGRR
jgi:two-component system chemotaxis response regulator CheB